MGLGVQDVGQALKGLGVHGGLSTVSLSFARGRKGKGVHSLNLTPNI